MKIFEVRQCDGCPMHFYDEAKYSDDAEHECQGSEKAIPRRDFESGALPEICPLREGNVLLRLAPGVRS